MGNDGYTCQMDQSDDTIFDLLISVFDLHLHFLLLTLQKQNYFIQQQSSERISRCLECVFHCGLCQSSKMCDVEHRSLSRPLLAITKPSLPLHRSAICAISPYAVSVAYNYQQTYSSISSLLYCSRSSDRWSLDIFEGKQNFASLVLKYIWGKAGHSSSW